MVKVNEHVAAVQHTKRADHRAIVVNTAQADTCMGSRKKQKRVEKKECCSYDHYNVSVLVVLKGH